MVNKTPPMGVLYSFSITNIFHDKMDLRFFHFHMIIYEFETSVWSSSELTDKYKILEL